MNLLPGAHHGMAAPIKIPGIKLSKRALLAIAAVVVIIVLAVILAWKKK
jgi:hypothetical protein